MIIIIITLFKEDNIFGRYASQTYGPQLTNIQMHDKMNIQSNIYNGMYNLKMLCARVHASYTTPLHCIGLKVGLTPSSGLINHFCASLFYFC